MHRRLSFIVPAILLVHTSLVLAEESWRYRLTPYLWFAGLEGDVASIPGLPSVPVDISPSDALEDTETSLMFNVDAKKGRHGLFADFLYSDVQSDEELVPPPIDLGLRTVTKTTLFTLACTTGTVRWWI